MKSLFAAVVGVLSLAGPARADLIVSGGFEMPAIASGFLTYPAGDPALTPWVITAGSVDIVTSFWPPFEGNQTLDLSGLDAGTISQTFATTPGAAYSLSFYYANHFMVPEASMTVRVLGTGTLLSQDLVHAGSAFDDMGWTHFTATFVADSAATTLSFTDTSLTPSFGTALDAVSVTPLNASGPAAVPGPSAVTVAGVALLAGLALRRRCRPAAA